MSDLPLCERVSVCCGKPVSEYNLAHNDPHCSMCGVPLILRCATHHGVWPSDTKQCPAAMTGNVTT